MPKIRKKPTTNVDSSIISASEAYLLASLLEHCENESLLQRALVTIGNRAAFTANQHILREAGCLHRLSELVKLYGVAVQDGRPVCAVTARHALTALNNLAMNDINQARLEDCILALLTLACVQDIDKSVRLGSLQVLTNLSVTSAYHDHYLDHLGPLCDIARSSSVDTSIKIQSLRLLVNLTANASVVQHLHSIGQDHSWLLDLLDNTTQSDIILRALNCLVNIHMSVDLPLTAAMELARMPSSDNFPGLSNDRSTTAAENDDKSVSASATGQFSREYLDRLQDTMTRMCRHSDEDIRGLALRLVSLLPPVTRVTCRVEF
jgi:hypothetical protein